MEKINAELERIQSEDLLRKKPYQAYRQIDNWEDMERFRKAKKYEFVWSIYRCIELGIKIPEKYRFLTKRIRRTQKGSKKHG